jgi:YidC/Oxa1 family membrane protein insertase
MDDQNKNLILAIALSGLVMLVWLTFFSPPEPVPPPPGEVATDAGGQPIAVTPPAASTAPATSAADAATEAALATAPRVAIETPRLSGSLSLLGGRIDTLALTDYKETLDPDSPPVTLLRPIGAAQAYYAVYGWAPAGSLDAAAVPDANTLYTLESGSRLTPDSPVTLKWDNGQGLIFRRTISVDADYMFTVTQSVENRGSAPVRLAPYGIIARHGQPDSAAAFVRHEGVVRQTDDTLDEIDYSDVAKLPAAEGAQTELTSATEHGWIGITDAYWMTTLIPPQNAAFT